MDRLPRLTRRDWLRLAAAGAVGCSSSGWIESLAADTSTDPRRRRACILLWMNGGPSQTDTFDLKPGHAHGGTFKAIETAVPGIVISEHLPKLARQMKDIAIIRAMSTKEGDHGRATFNLRTGYTQQGPIHYPTLGALVAKELEPSATASCRASSASPLIAASTRPRSAPGSSDLDMPPWSSVSAPRSTPRAWAMRGRSGCRWRRPASARGHRGKLRWTDGRLGILDAMTGSFVASHPGIAPPSHQDAYQLRWSRQWMRSAAGRAFELDEEPAAVRDSYGRTAFGQGCLLARRLVERGVPFVEVTLSSISGSSGFAWDTHTQNFESVKNLCGVLDPAWSALMDDLRGHGLLDSTLIVWMGGAFGRTPKINPNAGRDHFPAAWTTVLAGGGIKGGQVIGDTGPSGMSVKDRPVSVPDFLATVCRSVGIDPMTQNLSDARPADPDRGPEGEAASGAPGMRTHDAWAVGPRHGGGVDRDAFRGNERRGRPPRGPRRPRFPSRTSSSWARPRPMFLRLPPVGPARRASGRHGSTLSGRSMTTSTATTMGL